MKLPRVRFTIRRMMIAVAVVGLILGVIGSVRVIVHQGRGGSASTAAISIDPIPIAIAAMSLTALVVLRRRKAKARG